MRSYEIIKSEANRSGSRLQPTQPGAALIRRTSVCFPDDGDLAGQVVLLHRCQRKFHIPQIVFDQQDVSDVSNLSVH
jgi:hypothetical protein